MDSPTYRMRKLEAGWCAESSMGFVVDVQTGQEIRRYPQQANFIVFSSDSKYLVSVSRDGIARFFNVDYRTT